MRIKQLYIFLFFIWFGSTIIASATDKADSWTKEKESIVHEVISTFHNSLGFDYLTREECDSLNADGLLCPNWMNPSAITPISNWKEYL